MLFFLIFSFWCITISSLNLSDDRRELIPLQNSTKKIDFFPPYLLQNKKGVVPNDPSDNLLYRYLIILPILSNWAPSKPLGAPNVIVVFIRVIFPRSFWPVYKYSEQPRMLYICQHIVCWYFVRWLFREYSRTFKDKFNFFQKHLRTVSTGLKSRTLLPQSY